MSQATPIEVRRPQDARERDAARALRREVFVDEQGVPQDLEMDGRDADALHLVAIHGGEVIGTCRVVVDGSIAKLGRLAVKCDARGAGAGTALLNAAEAEARAAGARRMVLDAQTHATRLYSSRGYVQVGAPFREAGIEHVGMEKRLG